MQTPKTFEDLIRYANNYELYTKLIQQLNKDFLLANIDLGFHEDILPTSLKLMLHETVYSLIQKRFTDYLNLLYIIDVSENKIKQLDNTDTVELAQDVALLILKREWLKVWYRNKA